jgi:hypothetical protein
MSAETEAYAHTAQFSWWRGHPDLTEDGARLLDLRALQEAVQTQIDETTASMEAKDQEEL